MTVRVKFSSKCSRMKRVGQVSFDVSVYTHSFYIEVQHLFHKRRQLGHERFISVILTHVRDQYGPERC